MQVSSGTKAQTRYQSHPKPHRGLAVRLGIPGPPSFSQQEPRRSYFHGALCRPEPCLPGKLLGAGASVTCGRATTRRGRPCPLPQAGETGGTPRIAEPQEAAAGGQAERGVLILATEVWPHHRESSNPRVATLLLGARRRAPHTGWPLTNPLSHTGCQEAEGLRIQAPSQPLLLAPCPAGASSAKGTGSPLPWR